MMIIPFDDPAHPLREPEFTDVDEVIKSLVDGVDLGLSFDLAEYAEGCVEDHYQRYQYLIRQPDGKEAAQTQIKLAKEWEAARGECLALYRATVRLRSN